jgi:hypothetical protein
MNAHTAILRANRLRACGDAIDDVVRPGSTVQLDKKPGESSQYDGKRTGFE